MRRKSPDIVSGRTSLAQPGSMPVAWKVVPPAAHAAASRSTVSSPATTGWIHADTAVDTTFVPDARIASTSASAPAGSVSP